MSQSSQQSFIFPITPEPTAVSLFANHEQQATTDHQLAARYAPILQFDALEPFLPSVVGYTIFRESQPSTSFPRQIELGEDGVVVAIEYAIWWDWDIQHLYELEHVWVYLDGNGRVVQAEASWHGGYHDMAVDGVLPMTEERLTLFSESGKHAFAPSRRWLEARASVTANACTRYAGVGGVWITPLFKELIQISPLADRLVHTHLERLAFEPSLNFSKTFAISSKMLIPWATLFEWIPQRVAWWVAELERTIPPAERRVLRIAHRGASLVAPPSSVAAIAKAAELGADMVELDVQMCADSIPVISHPADIRRLGQDIFSLTELTLPEIKAIDLGGGETILTLDEAITCCQEHGVGLYLELKGNWVVEPVVKAIQEGDLYRQIMVGSFRPDWVADVKTMDADIVTSILFNSTTMDAVALAQAVGATYVHPCWERQATEPHKLLTLEWIQRVREARLGIICWHEERPFEIAALQQLGVDGICSDAPELLKV
ncbi:Glycerophosphoryl diester phosphodiesterase [hydrothermal vent metagenome]|uniref:Glycerophosphoryl diester phosphodiesterase n=1 Tax=hydrothermal vent metagenome TaxID=652676 RepID=A0A3B0UQX5_9ZZZZ